MEQKSDAPSLSQKIYSEIAIGLGALIGGPLAAGYFIAQNFRVFNEPGKARKTWIIAVAVMVAIICDFLILSRYTIFLNPVILLIIIAAVVWFLAARLQGERIRAHVSSGGLVYNWLQNIGVAFAGLVGIIVIVLGFALLLNAVFPSSVVTKTYGEVKNEITFDKKNMTGIEVDQIGDALLNASYFNEMFAKSVYAKKLEDGGYELFFIVPEEMAADTAELNNFRNLKTDLETSFADKKIGMNLVSGDLKNVLKKIE